MSLIKVLLIDDEQEFTAVLSRRLEARGMGVVTASTGEMALDKVKDQDFDAVLLDLAMPGWDGIETLKRLIEVRPDLQIVLLTGYATVQKGVEAMKQGAMDLLEKPADFQDVLGKIEQATEKKALLVEERMSDALDDILKKKGW